MNRFVCHLHEGLLYDAIDKRCLEKISDDVKRLEYTTDRDVISSLIKRCGNAKALTQGRQLQAHMSTTRHSDDIFLMNLLIEMFGKCESVNDASLVFNEIYEKNIFSWTIMLAAYAENGHYTHALQILWQMDQEGIRPNGFTFVSIIGACSSLTELQKFHARVLDMALQDLVLETVLLNAYGRCGSVEDARHVFDAMSERNLVSWNAMIAAYAQNGHHGYEALQLFREMDLQGLKHNKITFINTITACTSVGDLKLGEMIHQRVLASRFECDVVVANTLLNMYGKCRSLALAREVFDSIRRKTKVSWSAMIAAYALNGQSKEALKLYKEIDIGKLTPDKVIYLNLLDACASLGDLEEGKRLHEVVAARGLESEIQMLNSLMNMYGKSGGLQEAMDIFTKLPPQSAISWNTLISAYAQSGQYKTSIAMFRRMDLQGVKPDKITFMSVLEAVAATGNLREGGRIHSRLSELGYSSQDTSVSNSLLNMYSKCGNMSVAVNLFTNMSKPDQISWTSIIAGYAQLGHDAALEFYQRMDLEGVKPNQVTYLSILTACTHSGLLEDGVCYFMSMTSDHGVEATQQHYGCVVDLLGRAGWLDEAEKAISNMPVEPCAVVWTSLLGACCLHRDVERAERVVARVVEKEPGEAGAYVLLSNLYAAEERWEDVAKMRDMIDEFCTVKDTKPVSDARRRKLRAIRDLESASRTKP